MERATWDIQHFQSTKLTRDFIETRLKLLPSIRSVWELPTGHYYLMDLKQCFIRKLHYAFTWGFNRPSPVRAVSCIDEPSRIVVLDLSLNDFEYLDMDGLVPLQNLRVVLASCNHISRLPGIGQLEFLYTLDLSYNDLKDVEDLRACPSLAELDLSYNHLTSLAKIPLLHRLVILRVDGNKIESLGGIQGLINLRELYCARNSLMDITPVCTLRRLRVFDCSFNRIGPLDRFAACVNDLVSLEHLIAQGNPIDRDPLYWRCLADIVGGHLQSLDNVALGQILADPNERFYESNGILRTDADAMQRQVGQLFMGRIRESRLAVNEKVRMLQNRIVGLLRDQEQFERHLLRDMQVAYSHVAGLSNLTAQAADGSFYDWEGMPLTGRGLHIGELNDLECANCGYSNEDTMRRDTPDRHTIGKNLKETDNVLRLAALKLADRELGKKPRNK